MLNNKLRDELLLCETDLEGVMSRFAEDEELYVKCLIAFLNDTTMKDLKSAIASKSWDDAFTSAHALKGVAGNMGFVPLYHSTAEFVVKFRSGKIAELGEAFRKIEMNYKNIYNIINSYCKSED